MHRTRSLPLLALLVAGPAMAQADGPTTPPQPEVRWQPFTELDESDFDTLGIEGQLVGPAGQLVQGRRAAPAFTWIDLRADFDEELRASVDLVR